MPTLPFRAMRLALAGAATIATLPAIAMAQDELSIGIEGLGGIDASTPFDVSALRSTVRGIDWRPSARTTEDGSQRVIVGRRFGRTLVTIVSDGRGRIAAIEVASSRIGNWLGPRVGQAHRPLSDNLQLGECGPGAESQSGHVVCTSAETDRITYVFSGRWNGPDGQMPGASVLNDWTISQVIWRPDRFSQIGAPQTQRPDIRPSFNCANARGSIERLICSDSELAGLDLRMSALYARSMETASPSKASRLRAYQRGWIRARNECWKSSNTHQCVISAYNDRIAELQHDEDAPRLIGTSWRGLRIAGDNIPRNVDINLTFGNDGRLTGSSGCNRYFAGYILDGRTLDISQIGGTRRMCPDLQMLAETRFLEALGQIEAWAMRNGELVLYGSGAELTFVRM